MAGYNAQPAIRLVNFISEEQLDVQKKTRGERVEDGTAQRDRPLYDILRENKDKKDTEFNERFKHRPPKALDEDEAEFLDNMATARRQYDRQTADEEAQQLRSFQKAVEAQSNVLIELKETPPVVKVEEQKITVKKKPASRPLNMMIKVVPRAKKAKLELKSEAPSEATTTFNNHIDKIAEKAKTTNTSTDVSLDLIKTGLVSYSDESDED